MKLKLNFTAFTVKAIFIITCITVVFSGITRCDAQSIVGKWKGVSVKNYYSAEYAKMMGKSMEEKTEKEAGYSDIEYKADHTFIMTFSPPNSSEVAIMKGIWSLNGNQLKFTLEPKYNPTKTTSTSTILINGNTMITTAIMPSGYRIIKSVSTSTRM